MAAPMVKRRFTAEEYQKLGRAGILSEDDRVELIEGEIVQMSPIGSRHAAMVKGLNRLLTKVLGDRALISVQDPVRLDKHSEPQPDIAVLRPREDLYASRHPGPADTFFLIEVADTSEDYDRTHKVPLYARAGVAETWLVLLDRNEIEVYRDPSPEGYRDVRKFAAGSSLTPQAFPDVSMPFESILPAVK